MNRIRAKTLLLVLAVLTASAAEGRPAGETPKNGEPSWKRRPTAEMMLSVMPRRAFEKGVDGRARITCSVTDLGLLKDCAVVDETPEGFGFGAAALAMSPFFEMKPALSDGKPVGGGTVTIPIVWQIRALRGDAVDGRSLLASPPWAVAPSWAAVVAAWPRKADGVAEGFVTLRCRLTGEGAPAGCTALTEAPDNLGFESAARSLIKTFRLGFSEAERSQLPKLIVDIPFHFRNPAQGDPRKLTAPRWVRTVSPEAMASLYPAAARSVGVSTGLGWVRCVVTATGELANCATVREEPAGLGFGAAALEAARIMRMNPWTDDGEPVEGRPVNVPLRLNAQTAKPD